jgi:hypothetical protein
MREICQSHCRQELQVIVLQPGSWAIYRCRRWGVFLSSDFELDSLGVLEDVATGEPCFYMCGFRPPGLSKARLDALARDVRRGDRWLPWHGSASS